MSETLKNLLDGDDADLFSFLKAVLLGSTASSQPASDTNRKRKNDWMNQTHVDFGNQPVDGPTAKVATKDRDRRKSQGESEVIKRAFTSNFTLVKTELISSQ